MNLPLRDGSQFDLSPFLSGFRAKYPHIHDLDAELAKMHLWLARNPHAWPVKPFRFVDNWLRKIKPKPVKLHLAGGRMTERELLAAGAKIGLSPRPGESWASFGERIKGAA